LRKQLGWARTATSLFHFRDRDGREVDVVLEARDGRVAGVEVKAANTVTAHDFRGLQLLQDKLGDRFVGGLCFTRAEMPSPSARAWLPSRSPLSGCREPSRDPHGFGIQATGGLGQAADISSVQIYARPGAQNGNAGQEFTKLCSGTTEGAWSPVSPVLSRATMRRMARLRWIGLFVIFAGVAGVVLGVVLTLTTQTDCSSTTVYGGASSC
jgi:uncharacterized protein DUF4143